MKRSVYLTLIALTVLLLLFSVTVCAAETTCEGSEAPQVTYLPQNSTDTASMLFSIITCVLLGIIFSFYLIHKMKNKH